ncbi:MAG: FAD-dependent oxidoreductase [Pseudomonadota bacterium]
MYAADIFNTRASSGSQWESSAPALSTGSLARAPANDPYDVVIVGGGFTGLSAAYHLASEHQQSVCVLDAGQIGNGASGRNGGFCNVSPIMTYQKLLKKLGTSGAQGFVAAQNSGVDFVRDLIDELSLDVEAQMGGTAEVAHSPSAFADLQEKSELLASVFAMETEVLGQRAFAERLHDAYGQFGGLVTPNSFCLNPLRLARGIAENAAKAGADLVEDCKVERISKVGSLQELETSHGLVRGKKVILATNGYASDRLHAITDRRLMPVISQINVTRPLREREITAQGWGERIGCSTTHGAHYYYRLLPDNRLMFGGPGDYAGTADAAQRSAAALARVMVERFPALVDVSIERHWNGIVCTTQKFLPSVGTFDDDPDLHYGFGFHGNGVAAATWTGRQMASVLAGRSTYEAAFPEAYLGLPKRFPLAFLRPLYLRAAMAFRIMQD